MNRNHTAFFAFLLFGIVLTGCGKIQDQTTVAKARPSDDAPPGSWPSSAASTENPEPSETDRLAGELVAVLEKAYAASSSEQLLAFFQKWHDSYEPCNLATITDPVEKEVYRVYRAFYDPFDLSRLGGSELPRDFYQGFRYVIVQDSLTYETEPNGQKHKITEFRPPLEFENVDVLYLTPAYSEALTRFLGSKHLPMATGNLMAPARAKGESRKRLEFLGQYVKILHGHWSGWHLCTHPAVGGIRLDADRTRASVGYRVRYKGGSADLQKKQGRWKIEEARITWIE